MELSNAMTEALIQAYKIHETDSEKWVSCYHFTGTRSTLAALVKRGLLDVRGDVRYWGTQISADAREYRITVLGLDVVNETA